MWSLGKVVRSPEVLRVFLGSFWDHPFENEDFIKLFQAEQQGVYRPWPSCTYCTQMMI